MSRMMKKYESKRGRYSHSQTKNTCARDVINYGLLHDLLEDIYAFSTQRVVLVLVAATRNVLYTIWIKSIQPIFR